MDVLDEELKEFQDNGNQFRQGRIAFLIREHNLR
jgi:hypothetical protein